MIASGRAGEPYGLAGSGGPGIREPKRFADSRANLRCRLERVPTVGSSRHAAGSVPRSRGAGMRDPTPRSFSPSSTYTIPRRDSLHLRLARPPA